MNVLHQVKIGAKNWKKERENTRQMTATWEENIILASFDIKDCISSVFTQQSYSVKKEKFGFHWNFWFFFEYKSWICVYF